LMQRASSAPAPPELDAVEPPQPRELNQVARGQPPELYAVEPPQPCELDQVAPRQVPQLYAVEPPQPRELDQVAPRQLPTVDDVAPGQPPELDAVQDQCALEIEKLYRERDACFDTVRQQDSFVAEYSTNFKRTVDAVKVRIAKLEAAATMAEVIQALQAAKGEVANIPNLPDVPPSTPDDAMLSVWVRTRNAAVQSAASRVEQTLHDTRHDAEDFSSTLAARVSAFMQTNQGRRILASAPMERQSLCDAIQQLYGALMWKVLDMCDASLDVLGPLEALRQQLTEQGAQRARERDNADGDELRQKSRSQPSAERDRVSPSAVAVRESSPEPLAQEPPADDVDAALDSTGDDETDGEDEKAQEGGFVHREPANDDDDGEPQRGWKIFNLLKTLF